MEKYYVIYKDLRIKQDELDEFVKKLGLKALDNVGGFQRGLFVVKKFPFSQFFNAYSVNGYFVNHDDSIGNVEFQKERIWSERMACQRLGPPMLEEIMDMSEFMSTSLEGYFFIDVVSLAKYFFEKKAAFPKLAHKYETAKWRELEDYKNLMWSKQR